MARAVAFPTDFCYHDLLLTMGTMSLYPSLLIILERHFGYSYPYPNPYSVTKLSTLGHIESSPNTPESIRGSIDLFWKYPHCLIKVSSLSKLALDQPHFRLHISNQLKRTHLLPDRAFHSGVQPAVTRVTSLHYPIVHHACPQLHHILRPATRSILARPQPLLFRHLRL